MIVFTPMASKLLETFVSWRLTPDESRVSSNENRPGCWRQFGDQSVLAVEVETWQLFISLCLRVCVMRARVCVCMCACVCVRAHVHACMHFVLNNHYHCRNLQELSLEDFQKIPLSCGRYSWIHFEVNDFLFLCSVEVLSCFRICRYRAVCNPMLLVYDSVCVWFLIRVVFFQGGLSSGWGLIRVVFL